MEELLNKLIEKGWKPRGYGKIYKFGIEKGFTVSQPQTKNFIGFATKSVWTEDMNEPAYTDYRAYTLRELVSKESGLWQFVCDKGLVDMYEGFYWQNIFPLDSKEYDYTDYQYWILESALCNEEDLEKFLLENIKIC